MITINRAAFLDAPITVDSLHGVAFTNESGGHKFVISCYRDGAAENLTGTMSAKFLRADNSTIQLLYTSGNAVIVDGKAEITLHQDCYNVPGRFQMAVFNTVGNVVSCIYACVGTVIRSASETLIDSGDAVPDLEELMAKISECENATGAALAAKTAADNAAANALGNFAGAFDATKAYSAGQYVTYTDGKFYRLTADHAADVTWANTSKVLVTVGSELEAQGVMNARMNAPAPAPGWERGLISTSGAEQASNSRIRTANYIPLNRLLEIDGSSDAQIALRLYTADKTFIQGSSGGSPYKNGWQNANVFTRSMIASIMAANPTAAYCRFSGKYRVNGDADMTDEQATALMAMVKTVGIVSGSALDEEIQTRAAQNETLTGQVSRLSNDAADAVDNIRNLGGWNLWTNLLANGTLSEQGGSVQTCSYRVCTPDMFYLSTDTGVSAATGFKFTLYRYELNSSNQWVFRSKTNAVSSFSAAGDQMYRITIQRADEDTTETADIPTFARAVSLTSPLSVAVNAVEPLARAMGKARVAGNAISWRFSTAKTDCYLLVTGSIIFSAGDGSSATLTASDLYSQASAIGAISSVRLESDGQTLRGQNFAIVYDAKDKAVKLMRCIYDSSNPNEPYALSGLRYTVLFGHYNAAALAFGLLVDSGTQQQIIDLEANKQDALDRDMASYFKTEAETCRDSLEALCDEPCYVVGFVTDSHYYGYSGGSNWPRTAQNIAYVNSLYPLDCVIHGGDIVTGNISRASTVRDIRMVRAGLAGNYKRAIMLTGNHDDNSYYSPIGRDFDTSTDWIDDDALFGLIGRLSAAEAHFLAGYNACWWDVDGLGLRIVCLDAILPDSLGVTQATNWGYTADEITWLTSVLTAAKAAGLQVAVFSHMPATDSLMDLGSNGALQGTEAVRSAVNTFISGGGTFVGWFHGHTHWDALEKVTGNSFFECSTGCSLYEQTIRVKLEDGAVVKDTTDTSPIGSSDYWLDPDLTEEAQVAFVEAHAGHVYTKAKQPGTIPSFAEKYQRDAGDVTEDLWDIIVIKPGSKQVRIVRFGAGSDRTFSYGN